MTLRILTLLILTLVPLYAPAQETATEQLERGIRQSYSTLQTLTCSYTLTRKVAMLEDVAQEKGTLTYSKPQRTLILANTTADSTIISPTGITTVKDGRRQTINPMRNTATRQMMDIITACFSGNFSAIRQSGHLTATNTGPTTIVTFTPTDRRAMRHFSSILLTFGNDDYGLRQMTVSQKGGDFLSYSFGKKKSNIGKL